MGLLDPALFANSSSADAADKAARALESIVLKQMLQSSGMFKGGDAAGSGIRADMFAEALADAVASAGGIGLGAQLSNGLPVGSSGSPPLSYPAPVNYPAPVPTARIPDASIVNSAADLVPGGRVSSNFGKRVDPIHGRDSMHSGVDVAAPEGTPILAAADGVVRSAGTRGNYGFAVEIDHGNGVSTLYGHASELVVREGERVSKGQVVARVGHTGRSTGPHLHFEVRVDDKPADPTRALKAYASCADVGVER